MWLEINNRIIETFMWFSSKTNFYEYFLYVSMVNQFSIGFSIYKIDPYRFCYKKYKLDQTKPIILLFVHYTSFHVLYSNEIKAPSIDDVKHNYM